jgi:hypothetical protein
MPSGVVGLTPLFQAAWALALFPTRPVGCGFNIAPSARCCNVL